MERNSTKSNQNHWKNLETRKCRYRAQYQFAPIKRQSCFMIQLKIEKPWWKILKLCDSTSANIELIKINHAPPLKFHRNRIKKKKTLRIIPRDI